MNIFDPLISGSLSVSGSGEISGDLRVLGTINATISGTTSNAISASHAAEYLLTSSFEDFTGSYTTGSFTGSFSGDGSGLTNIPASGVTGLNLTRIADGSATASISQAGGFVVNTNTIISGSVNITGSISLNGEPIGTGKLDETIFNSYTSSNDTTNSTQTGRLGAIEVTTASLNNFSSSADSRLDLLEAFSGSIENSLNSYTSSNDITNNNQNGRLNSLEITTGSNIGRLNAIETTTSSLSAFTSSINDTIKSKLNVDGVISSSIQVNLPDTLGYTIYSSSVSMVANNLSSSIGSLSSSIASDDFIQVGRITSLEQKTGSYATTGSNQFNGNQTITGSLTVTNNLTVLGSSSIVYSTASQLIVEDNVIVVNASYPAERFAGLEIHDSGSNGSVTASLFWDGLNNRFVYRNTSDAYYGGAMFIGGPRNTGSLGDEPTLTSGRIPKSIGGDHIGDSIINETNGSIGISGSLSITGSIVSIDTPLVSSSTQISFNGITDKPTIVSGSSQITYSGLSSIPSGIISGSAQVISSLPSGTVSGSAQVSYTGLSNIPSGIISGSAQLTSTFVQKSGDTMTGQLIVGATGLAGAGTLKINNSSAATFNHSIEAFAVNMTAGQTNGIFLGQAGSTKNAGYLGYNWSSSASNSNYISLGHWGADNLLRVYGDGTVYLGTVTTGVWNGTAIGDSYISSATSWNTAYSKRPSSLGFTSSTVTLTLGDASTITASVPTFNQNTSGTASNITSYTINQNLGTSNAPTFNGLTVNGASYFNGSIGNAPSGVGVHIGVSAGSDGQIQIIGPSAHIDFANANSEDFDARLILTSNDTISFEGVGASGLQVAGQTVWNAGNDGSGSGLDADTVDGVQASGLWQTGGSWGADLTSNGFTRQIGVAYVGGEFALLTNNSQISTLIDGTYFAGEQGGFYSLNASNNYSSRVGFNRDGSGNASFNASIVPTTNGTLNLGSSSARWNTVFTSDLSMSNGIGDYTIVEGEEDLFIYNNKTNKVFKFLLQEVDPSIAPPKKV